MKDSDVRSALHAQVLAEHHHHDGTRVVDEMGVWSGTVRIDVAVLNGEMCGFEIKSDRDTLARLPYQVEIYGKVFDRLTLVVGKKHEKAAAEIVPKWWGIIVAQQRDTTVVLKQRRLPRKNKQIDPNVLVQQIWKDEGIELLAELGFVRGWKSRSLGEVYAKILAELTTTELSNHVREIIKRRSNWLGQQVVH